jgi:hypothetical protein
MRRSGVEYLHRSPCESWEALKRELSAFGIYHLTPCSRGYKFGDPAFPRMAALAIPAAIVNDRPVVSSEMVLLNSVV